MVKDHVVKLLDFGMVQVDVVEDVLGFFLFAVDVGFEFRCEVEERDFALNEMEDLNEELAEGERGLDQNVKILISNTGGFLLF